MIITYNCNNNIIIIVITIIIIINIIIMIIIMTMKQIIINNIYSIRIQGSHNIMKNVQCISIHQDSVNHFLPSLQLDDPDEVSPEFPTVQPWGGLSTYSLPGLVNIQKTMERSTILQLGKLTISIAIFNSYVTNYQAGYFLFKVTHVQPIFRS